MNRPDVRFPPDGCAPARFTAEEFLRMAALGAFDDMKVELDHGELVRMNPPFAAHGSMQARLIAKLSHAVGGTGLTVTGETGIALGEDTIRAFDVAVVETEAREHRLIVPEEVRLGIEVAATSIDYDLGPKRRDYAAAGIVTYWVVDLKARVVHVASRPGLGGYEDVEVARFGEPLRVPGTRASIVID